MSNKARKIVFFHPDLGIGGAERLVVDAAVGLQNLGHKVVIYTSHCDKRHCFEEVRDGTLDVRVRGNSIFPATILGRLHILLASLRQLHLFVQIAVFTDELYGEQPDAFLVDQLSACVPLLRWFYSRRQRILFYCHFPDQLLAKRGNILKELYRFPFDWFEGWSMSASDRIVVNSRFTKMIAMKTFGASQQDFGVIYPCVDYDAIQKKTTQDVIWAGKFKILLSINRFERKKGIELALRAYSRLSAGERKGTRLVIAGGYDPRVQENIDYHRMLENLSIELGLRHASAKTMPTALALPEDVEVAFLLSISEALKTLLLQNARLLIYTPSNEHFGIVPVEAMCYGVPVVASNTGGPLETVVDGETGWLLNVEDEEAWTKKMALVINDDSTRTLSKRMGEQAKARVKSNFTNRIMAKRFDEEITSMLRSKRGKFLDRDALLMAVGMTGVFLAALLTVVMRNLFGAVQHSPATMIPPGVGIR